MSQGNVAASAANPLDIGGFDQPFARPASVMSEHEPSRLPSGSHGFTRVGETARPLVGGLPTLPDKRKFYYDALQGMSNPLTFAVSRDDRMSAEQAGAKLHKIHQVMGIEFADPAVLYAFDCGMWFCHTVNSGSVLVPGRSEWKVPGYTETFQYSTVRDVLGNDMRRFFRAFADEIRAVNQHVLDAFDPRDIGTVEQRGWLEAVAAERNLSRHPALAHDSADACLTLSPTERMAVMNSKRLVIEKTANVVDAVHKTSRVKADGVYDSTGVSGRGE